MKPKFSRQLFAKYSIINFAKNGTVQWEPRCSMRTDGPTDMTKLVETSRNFENALKNRLSVILKQIMKKYDIRFDQV